MPTIFTETLTLLYAGVWLVAAAGYYGTIRDLFRGIPNANIPSYAVWTWTSLISLLYGVFVLRDVPFVAVSSVNFAACGTILALATKLKPGTVERARNSGGDGEQTPG